MGCSISAISDSGARRVVDVLVAFERDLFLGHDVRIPEMPEGDAAAARSARARTDAARRRPAPTNAKEGRAARARRRNTVAMRE